MRMDSCSVKSARTTLGQIQSIVLYVGRRINIILKKCSQGDNLCSFDFSWIYIPWRDLSHFDIKFHLVRYDTRCALRQVESASTDSDSCKAYKVIRLRMWVRGIMTRHIYTHSKCSSQEWIGEGNFSCHGDAWPRCRLSEPLPLNVRDAGYTDYGYILTIHSKHVCPRLCYDSWVH